MRAVMCRQFGPPESLSLEEVPDPEPAAGQVVVDVAASSVNFPDLLMIKDEYQFKPGLPFSPGGEVAGTVSAVGEGVDAGLIGTEVMALCGVGGFSERLAVAQRALLPIPAGMDMPTAASFLTAYGTSYHALKDRGRLAAGEVLLVLGAAGGVGLAAVDIGAALGAVVIAAASSEAKLAAAGAHGAAMTINYAEEDLRARLKELTGGQGPDIIYDPVGGDLAEPAFRSIGWNGRYLVVGFAGGPIPRLPLNLPLLKGAELVGVYWGSFTARQAEDHRRNMDELAGLWSEGKLHPAVSSVFPLEEAAAALNELGDRRVIGKAVVTTARP
ncbi:MAG: NADPH:quinone oxidoreductase family protein [Acidimicrobiales bacterium]